MGISQTVRDTAKINGDKVAEFSTSLKIEIETPENNLGVVFDGYLNFNIHIDNILKYYVELLNEIFVLFISYKYCRVQLCNLVA